MQLPALSVAGVRQLLDAAGSALDAGAIFQLTGGNSFYVTEVIAAGSAEVPATVRDAVLARMARLSPAGTRGRRRGFRTRPPSRDRSPGRVSGQPLTAVDDCLERGVLIMEEGAVGFRHDLARLAAERSLLPLSAPRPTPGPWRR